MNKDQILTYFKSQIGKDKFTTPSPVGAWLDGKVLAAEEGSLSFEFEVRKEMTNPMGILHGGISALIIDEVIGATVHTLGHDTFFTSVNLSVDFLRSVPAGTRVKAVSKVIRSGKTIVNANCEVFNEEGKVLAKGMSNLVRTFQKK